MLIVKPYIRKSLCSISCVIFEMKGCNRTIILTIKIRHTNLIILIRAIFWTKLIPIVTFPACRRHNILKRIIHLLCAYPVTTKIRNLHHRKAELNKHIMKWQLLYLLFLVVFAAAGLQLITIYRKRRLDSIIGPVIVVGNQALPVVGEQRLGLAARLFTTLAGIDNKNVTYHLIIAPLILQFQLCNLNILQPQYIQLFILNQQR